MAIKSMPEKRFQYYLSDGSTETLLNVDPKGWDNHEIGFSRSDDFGINIQNVVPLSFSGDGREYLKAEHASKGLFAKTKTIIKKRIDNWTYAPFYVYKHDYSTYKDDLKYVEISGIEDGLAKKYDTYKDTEYEIDLPSSNKLFIDYTGASYVDKNIIQCLYGEMKEYKFVGTDYYALKGNRSVRSYNDKIAFTDGDGLPYTTMTFRALQTYTDLNLKLELFVTIEADGAFGTSGTSQGQLCLIKHSTFASAANEVVNKNTGTNIRYNPDSTSSPGNNRIDTFARTVDARIDIVQGQLYTLFYEAEDKSYDDVSVTDGGKCFIELSNLVSSAYQNQKLECFTYEWLIEQLLLKIDSTATFESTVLYPNVKELLTATPCILNMGAADGTGKIKTTLKDVLESFNKLKCIAIDITGQKMTISNLLPMYDGAEYVESTVYSPINYGELKCNNIMIEHDVKHQYNKVKVGADTADREDDDPLVYPFICKKEFSVEDTISENELDLVNNFMLDPYEIDKYIRETLGDEDNNDECEFMVMACKTIENYSTSLWGNPYKEFIGDGTVITPPVSTPAFFVSNLGGGATVSFDVTFQANEFIYNTGRKIGVRVFNLSPLNTGIYYLEYDINGTNEDPIVVNLKADIKVAAAGTLYIQVYGIAESADPYGKISILVSGDGYSQEESFIKYNANAYIYKSHSIIGDFSGDKATIYNIPLTPKRILQRWADYLALSTYGSDNNRLKYGTSTILKTDIISRCDYETADVEENSNLDLTQATAIFLPSTVTADTTENISNITLFENEDKYKYFTLIDKKKNKTYRGWINDITFAPTKNNSKTIVLQAKEI